MPEDLVEVDLRKHIWMQMDVTQVEPMGIDEEGDPVLIGVGETEIGVGCFRCNIGLTADNMDSECEGEQDVRTLE